MALVIMARWPGRAASNEKQSRSMVQLIYTPTTPSTQTCVQDYKVKSRSGENKACQSKSPDEKVATRLQRESCWPGWQQSSQLVYHLTDVSIDLNLLTLEILKVCTSTTWRAKLIHVAVERLTENITFWSCPSCSLFVGFSFQARLILSLHVNL